MCSFMPGSEVHAADTTTLNHTKWKELSESLDYTEKQETEKEKTDHLDFETPKLPMNSGVLKASLFILILAFIIFILYKLEIISLIRSRFSKKEKIHNSADHEEDSALTPSQELFSEAMKEKDHRLSLRLIYLACLHYLAESDILKLGKDITNATYVRKLTGHKTQDDFRGIVRVHELTWFGDKEISEEEYQAIVVKAQHLLSNSGIR